jgi:hypothetical protein
MIEERSAAWRIGQSWFMLLTLPLGFFSWMAFLYMGIRARRMKWVWTAVFFLAGTIAVMEVGPRITGAVGPDGRPTLTPMGGIAMLFLWGFSIWWAWNDRREFLEILDVRQGGTPAPVAEFVPYEQQKQARAAGAPRPPQPAQNPARSQPAAATPRPAAAPPPPQTAVAPPPPPAPPAASPLPRTEAAPPAPPPAPGSGRVVDF